MTIERLDKRQEQEVLGGIGEAIRAANAGASPSEAIAKVASEHGYNQNFVKRMVEAFNVSKTLKQVKMASGEGRAAPFELADVDEVTSLMYPEAVQTPAEKSASEWVPLEATLREDRTFNLDTAPVLSERKEVHSYDDVGPDNLLKRAYREADRKYQEAEQARVTQEDCRNDAIGAVTKFANYFRQTGSVEPFERVEKAALQSYGAEVQPLLTVAWNYSRAGTRGEKRASGPEKVTYGDRRPYVLLSEAADKRAEFVKSAKAYVECKAAADEFKGKVDLRMGLTSKSSQLAAALGGGLASRVVADAAKTPALYDALLAATAEIEDPDMEAERKSIRTKMLLRDMMKNDPILQKADPNAVIKAFNELSSLAPEALEQPAALRTMLQRGVEQGQMDILDITNTLAIEKGIRDSATEDPLLGPQGKQLAGADSGALEKVLKPYGEAVSTADPTAQRKALGETIEATA